MRPCVLQAASVRAEGTMDYVNRSLVQAFDEIPLREIKNLDFHWVDLRNSRLSDEPDNAIASYRKQETADWTG